VQLLEVGIPPNDYDISIYEPEQVLKAILDDLKIQIRGPLGEKEWKKLAWLFDRIGQRLGVPPAPSYPRVRLGDVV
jgi:hypothetical protein